MNSLPDYIQLKMEIPSYRELVIFWTAGDRRLLKINHIRDNTQSSFSCNVELRLCIDGISYDKN